MPIQTLRSSSLLIMAAAISVSLTGCAINSGSTSAAKLSPSAATAQFAGKVHGGNQAVIGAVMQLWAAGAPTTGGGYGTGATLLGATTTLGDGSFTFDLIPGTSPCTTGQYLYITAKGGNTGAGANTSSAMMTALPAPCGPTTGAQQVWINEVTTVAAVTALQQFMSITPGGVIPWQIGAPATNKTGLANAFAGLPQLVNAATGVSANSSTTSTVGGVIYTTTISVDAARINTLADVLAACVNSTGGSTCSSLFADVTPGSAGTPTASAPTDTIQAAYDVATNPGGLTMNAHGAANSPTWLCNNYVTGIGAPFLPALTCGTNTNDWLIGVNWKTVNPTPTTIGTVYAASVAIDGTGNVWIGSGSGVTANFVNQFNPSGQLVMVPVSNATIGAYNFNFVTTGTGTPLAYAGSTAYPLGYARPFGLAIDTGNNAWFNAYGAVSPGTLTNGTLSVPAGVIAQVNPAGVATGYIVPSSNGAMAIDGANNIYMGSKPTASYYLSELVAAGGYQTFNEGLGSGSKIYNSMFVDGTANQYLWGFGSSTTCTNFTILHVNTAQESSQVATTNITDPAACAYYGAPDAVGNAWVTASGNLYYIDITSPSTTLAAPNVTTITGSTNTVVTGTGGTGGLDNAAGVAIDGVGNVWVVNRPGSTVVGGLSEFAPVTTGGTTTYTALSPTGLPGEFGFQLFGASAVQGVQIDLSGNLWINTTSNSLLYHVVGAAAPVVTPTALAVKNGAIAIRP